MRAVNPSDRTNGSIKGVTGFVPFMPMARDSVMTNAPPYRPPASSPGRATARSNGSAHHGQGGRYLLLQSPAKVVVLSIPSPGPIVVDSVIFFM